MFPSGEAERLERAVPTYLALEAIYCVVKIQLSDAYNYNQSLGCFFP